MAEEFTFSTFKNAFILVLTIIKLQCFVLTTIQPDKQLIVALSRLFSTDGAHWFSKLVDTASVTNLEIVWKEESLFKVLIRFLIYCFFIKKGFGSTWSAFEAFGALPATCRLLHQTWPQTPVVIRFVARVTNEQPFPVFGRVAYLTESAIVAAPVIQQICGVTFGLWQTERVETFSAQIATQKVLSVTESAAEITHFFKQKCRFCKAYFGRGLVPTLVEGGIIHPQLTGEFVPHFYRIHLKFAFNNRRGSKRIQCIFYQLRLIFTRLYFLGTPHDLIGGLFSLLEFFVSSYKFLWVQSERNLLLDLGDVQNTYSPIFLYKTPHSHHVLDFVKGSLAIQI